MHHYFRTQVTFIKSRWVRTLSFPVFAHFLSIAARMYGNIPSGKGEDDGTILTLFMKQNRFPTEFRAAKWEQVKDVVEKYKVCDEILKAVCWTNFACGPQFIPFSDRVCHQSCCKISKQRFDGHLGQDPMMAQFPLVLAIEPRLLPYARLNGFHMDRKVSYISSVECCSTNDVLFSIVTSCFEGCLRSLQCCSMPARTK